MFLKVLPKTVPIPHTVLMQGAKVVFNPVSDVDIEQKYAEATIKARPNIFAAAEKGEKHDVIAEGYKIKDITKNIGFQEKFASLNDEHRLKIIDAVDRFYVEEKTGKAVAGGTADEDGPTDPNAKEPDGLDKKNLDGLYEFAEAQTPPIEIPEETKIKKDIVAFIREELKKRA